MMSPFLIITIAHAIAIVVGFVVSMIVVKIRLTAHQNAANRRLVPEVLGLPIIGNLLRLKEKKPHKTFTELAEIYGPIYSIKTGSRSTIVINSTDIAKEAMVTKYSSISTRKLPKALNILSQNKSIISMSDYGDVYNMLKLHLLTSVSSPTAQKKHRSNKAIMVDNIVTRLQAHVEANPRQVVAFRKIFESELFGLSMRLAIGKEVESIYVEELKTEMSREDIFKALVLDPLDGIMELDWREFFPYLRWIPNRRFERKIERMHVQRDAVMSALIREQKQRIASGEVIDCYLDHLLTEASTLTDLQIRMLIWEMFNAASDSTLVATEWAMYELAKHPERQERLFREIQSECGSKNVSEEHLSKLPYLCAVFHETLRRHTPVPLIASRHVDEDTELGGFHIPAGTEIAINLYGCNMDEKQWENPEEWLPERFLKDASEPVELYKTMSFSRGKRACTGALQAMLISCASIGRMVQKFEWRLREEEQDLNEDTLSLTSRKVVPLHAIIKPRC